MAKPDQRFGPTRRIGDLVVALRPLSPAAPWLGAWRTLAAAPAFDNLFYHPDFAIPAAGPFGSGVRVMLVGDRAPEEPGLRLLALWPIRVTRRRWGLPLAIGWMHPFGVFGVPLLDGDDPATALAALFSGLDAVGQRRAMLTHVPTRGAFADLLAGWAAAAGTRRTPFWAHARALLDLTGRSEAERAAYLGHLSARRRRRLRQSRERLEADTPLAFDTARTPGAVAAALDDFIALEGAGWKGRTGAATALACRPDEAAFVAAAVAAFAARGAMRIDRLHWDGRSLASALTFATRGRVWCLKIAFDETAARDSPGAQHLHHLTRSLIDDPTVTVADSCAPPDFFLAETFWAERLPLAHVLVETRAGDRFYGLGVRLESLRAAAVRAVKRWRGRDKPAAEAE
ncbi:GNAT family N-acetyltransferase [Methylobacterium sp. Leaf466]|uniref:GNAT family N-acetyltransferase n=1 Tax=Methylobacterium sp. Leaf466 TaxID=1736386 RepID=UPI0006F5FE39|nr:GNAT family N-acetyltransferase [Methylobacterium sp. Leaf466]KQT77376.1 hypothetical protein ASG59_12365 [Methylobacterium sp. Leaf466]